MKILALNSGSSSQKSCLYDVRDTLPASPPEPVWQAKAEWNGNRAEVTIETAGGEKLKEQRAVESREKFLESLLESLWSGKTRVLAAPSEINVVGHRVVNGGKDYRQATVITAEVKAAIRRMDAFAPLHNRAELEGMEIVEKQLGKVQQVAVFDTGFHSQLPEAAFVYPGPYEWLEQGIRRYGFHGINHEYCAGRAAQMLGKELRSLKLVTCHLGNGCSLAAIQDGHSVDTTMGFTPLEGLMMGTRSGSVDPGILTYLMRHGHYTGERLDELLNKQSGLLGISGSSGDMREVVTSMKAGDARAKLAFDIFVHRLQSGIGAMIAVLGGIDALIFSAGIGENSVEVRAAACANFGYLKLALDPAKNAAVLGQDHDITGSESGVRVLVVRAQEDWAIARDCWKLTSEKPAGKASPA
ncbi:MAG: acetate kinase [Candidatus Acidiferrales bacterium]